MKTYRPRIPVPVRAAMPMGGFTSCLPPIRTRPPVPKPPLATGKLPGGLSFAVTEFVPDDTDEWYEEPTQRNPLDNLSDKELNQLRPIADALKAHDWYYEYSDDGDVWRRGNEERTRINALLASIPTDQARALWAMYAPPAFGEWKLTRHTP